MGWRHAVDHGGCSSIHYCGSLWCVSTSTSTTPLLALLAVSDLRAYKVEHRYAVAVDDTEVNLEGSEL
jgi:hypothetical protein